VATTKLELRYADYIEDEHKRFLNHCHQLWEELEDESPYQNYPALDIDSAFFCAGNAISDFPALYDMFGKFMSAFDVEVLWNYIFADSFNATEINANLAAEIKLIDDNFIIKTLPDFATMMRDLNAVITSSFVIGKAAIEDARIKALSKVSLRLKCQAIDDLKVRMLGSLRWSKQTITDYANLMKSYYMLKPDVDDSNYKFETRDKLWPLDVLDFERAGLGALQGAFYEKTWLGLRKRSNLSKGLLIASYTVTGICIGFHIGAWWGAVIGAVIGCIIGIAIVLLE